MLNLTVPVAAEGPQDEAEGDVQVMTFQAQRSPGYNLVGSVGMRLFGGRRMIRFAGINISVLQKAY